MSVHDRFEEVEQALKDADGRKESLVIENLNKIYPSGKQAVSNLNLSMYQVIFFYFSKHIKIKN